jgi:hypothetical protein
MEATNLAGLYNLPLLDWSRIEARLAGGLSQAPGTGGPNRHTCWLATINPDGSPHVTGVGALWADGCFWFETGRQSRKGRNLARDPRCTLSVAAQEFDLVVTASRRARPLHWAPSIPAAQRGGGFSHSSQKRQATSCRSRAAVRSPTVT